MHFCEIILKYGHLPKKRCRFKVLAAILYSSGIILAIMVKRHVRNIPLELFQNKAIDLGVDVISRLFSIF